MTIQRKNEIIKAAIEGALVGGALGAALTGTAKNTLVSALSGAAIAASLKALEEAKELDLPVMYEENGIVYKQFADGTREVVRKIKQSSKVIPHNFNLG